MSIFASTLTDKPMHLVKPALSNVLVGYCVLAWDAISSTKLWIIGLLIGDGVLNS